MNTERIVIKMRHILPILVLSLLCSNAHGEQPIPPEQQLLPPRAEPYALKAGSGKVTVTFHVTRLGQGKGKIYLRRVGQRVGVLMNDLGRAGDSRANDGVYAARITVDTASFKPDSCIAYSAYLVAGRSESHSGAFDLCVSSLPVRASTSDKSHLMKMDNATLAVADELLLIPVTHTSAQSIRRIAAQSGAKVVGRIPALDIYQLRLPGPVSATRLTELIAQLAQRPEIDKVSVNAVGSYAYTPSDPEYPLQHGLQRVRAQDAWDLGATGAGVTVTVVDSGLNKSHADFGTPGNCQLAENDCGAASTDLLGHGTQVAGIVAAKTNNALGVAGVAYGSKVHSIQLSADAIITDLEMIQGFNDAAAYVAAHGEAKVVNASISVLNAFANWPGVCGAIDSLVQASGVPRAIVVNSVGNQGNNSFYYPARCNDLQPALTRKDLFITVANSVSLVHADCASAALDQRCSTSNYGAWVDIAAPGSVIRSTALGGGYVSQTGTSFAAPIVSGAAAILQSCGVPLEQIESTLRTSANVTVTFPDGSSAPRLDIYRALQQRDRAPTGVNMPAVALNEGMDTSAGVEVGTLTAVDPDSCDRFSFSIVGGADAASFAISGSANDRLRLTAGVLDYETKTSYAVIVRVTDFNGLSFDQPLTVSVNDLNDTPPVITTPAALNVNENATFSVPLSATDVDTVGINPANFSISGGVDAAKFSIVGTNLTMTAKDYEAPSDADANNTYVVQLSASDGVNTTVKTITVTVNDVNDNPPVITTIATQNVNENVALSVPLTSTDSDTVGINPANFSITGGADAAQFSIVGSNLTMSAKNYEAPADADSNNSYVVQVSADDGVNSVAKTITVVVNDVNDIPPFITTAAAQNVNENTAFSTPLSSTDADTVGIDPANFSIIGGADAAQFSIVGSNLTMSAKNYEAPADADSNNSYVVQLSANDGVNTTVSTFTVTVNNVNDAPTGRPYIDGVRTVGQTLTARTSTSTLPNPIADEDGLGTFHYQWLRGSTAVGADSDTYTLVPADLGAYMSVCVSYTDGGGHAEQVCSGADALAVGDPHLITVDGLHYDFQSAGEFVALRGINGMEIQTRHTPVSTASAITDPYSGLTAAVSINTAVAARVGKHRVTFQVSSAAVPADMVIRVDGVIMTLPQNGLALGIAGRLQPLPNGAIQLDFPDQTTLIVARGWWAPHAVWYLNLTVLHTPAYEGLMGARASGSWLPRLSDGTTLGAMPANLQDRYIELYGRFADSWRVSDKTSLFDYVSDTSTQTYTLAGWPKIEPPYLARGPVAKPVKRAVAQLACRVIKNKVIQDDCVFDVMVTGNVGFARTYLIQQGILAGLTRTRLQTIKSGNGDKDTLTYIATVEHDANAMAGDGDAAIVPSGTILFMLDEKPVARPVKLDGKGQASLALAKSMVSDLHVMARYLPSKGSRFLTSNSPDETLKLSKKSGK